MNKMLGIFVILAAVIGTPSGGGNADNVVITEYSSQIYTDEEIASAIDTTIDYFEDGFSGCTLTEISYVGDENLDKYTSYLERFDADDVIAFTSSFDVDSTGGDGSINPNQTYTGWNWILVRTTDGNWTHVDHGY